jgi:hypothetical protein
VGLKISAFFIFIFFWGFSELFSILEVEIGRNGPGILGVKTTTLLLFGQKIFLFLFL